MDFIKVTVTFALLFFIFPHAVAADEVFDSLERAGKLYKQGSYSQAVSELQFAAGLIQDKQMERYKEMLPDPPAGWTGDMPRVSRATILGFAGGITVCRAYYGRDSGSVTVEAVTDSPLVSGLAMILGNSMIPGSNRLVMVNGEKAIEAWDQNSGSGKLQMIIQKRMLLTISGTDLKSKDVLYDFGKKMDFKKIKKILQE